MRRRTARPAGHATWIAGYLLAGLTASGLLAEPPASEVELAASVRRYLDLAAQHSSFSGVVLVAAGDRILIEEARGFADFELAVPLAPEHILRLGSLTKPITASAVLRLAERGEIPLAEPICRWIPRCPATWQPITVRHLLSHSSGLPEYFGDLEAVPVEETAEEVDRLLASFSEPPALEEPPGSAYAYRNFNYVLLGYLLEQEAGAPWETVLAREIFDPLGLTTLRYDDVFEIVPARAHGYDRANGVLRNIEYDDHAAYAAGGLRGTARDLFAWFRALRAGRIVGEALLEQAFSPQAGDYGYGWGIRGYFGRQILSHTGGIDGFSSVLMYDRAADLVFVVLSNVESDTAILRACDLLQIAVERPSEIDLAIREALEPRERCGLVPPFG